MGGWKQGKIIKIPAFETLWKVEKYTKSSNRDLAAVVFPPLALAALTQREMSR
jgi:hypothetical protein